MLQHNANLAPFLPPTAAMRHLLAIATLFLVAQATAQQPPTRDEAAAALNKAVTFFREKVSAEGGYLWRYSEDLSLREGEEKATATQAWLQPPGTPSVGEAFLSAYERGKEECLLHPAIRAARGLAGGPPPSRGPGQLTWVGPPQ